MSDAVARRTLTCAIASEGRRVECCEKVALVPTVSCVFHVLVPTGTRPTSPRRNHPKQPSLPRCVSLPLVFLVFWPSQPRPVEGSEVETSTLWKGSEVRKVALSRSNEQGCCCMAGTMQTRHEDGDLESDLNAWTVTTSRNRDLENGVQRYSMYTSCVIVWSVFLSRQWSVVWHEHNDALRLTLANNRLSADYISSDMESCTCRSH